MEEISYIHRLLLIFHFPFKPPQKYFARIITYKVIFSKQCIKKHFSNKLLSVAKLR
ncbi:hypothetical protein CSE_13820 [Caldisericum exile AZM16c01]|uniref:Uncharacterized protein n=1 Tax=Caldisericum exile (strain DSM 21853 / NBRC 104410 / AZM16c01) TaxID=511051 RepID=A0A7U6GFK7_CALEA|nr:hypothetical protein CSE_13820 [Caldisericum exile AZM16c01]